MQIYSTIPHPRLIPKYDRMMGIDLGEKWMGIALSDKLQMTANPHTLLRRARTFAGDAAALRTLIREQDVGFIVLGYPLSLDGSKNSRVQATEAFARNLSRHGDIDLPVLFWDERMTSQEANRILESEMDLTRKRRGELEDKLAASIILSSALEAIGRAREDLLLEGED